MRAIKLESEAQEKILRYLEKISYVVKIIVANRSGVVDVIGCYNGRFYSIELKRLGEKPTALQIVNILKVRKHGGIAFTATSLDEVKTYFNNLQ